MREGFSPHPWGWTSPKVRQRIAADVFPTPVGMDRREEDIMTIVTSFPHTRGDGPSVLTGTGQSFAFSPHPWGWTYYSHKLF